jgi:phenylalanyl-tRNA synthetase alpha chain
MSEELENLEKQIEEKIANVATLDGLNSIKVEVFGKKGLITNHLKSLAELPENEKKEKGKKINDVKNKINILFQKKNKNLSDSEISQKLQKEEVDVTLSTRPIHKGKLNPITQTIAEVTKIFQKMGFETALGPDIEDDYHNFTALNIPPEHPARQLHDTFYIKGKNNKLLRTHTSPVQIRTLEKKKPPLRIIAPGRTYRADSDMTHTPMFHQVEGLYLDVNVNMSQLKGCIMDFCREFFEIDDLPVRFRPSFFPFTEPSAEIDIGCFKDKKQIRIGNGGNWLEIMGCGMVHNKVLKYCKINSNKYQGFAFGLGVERLAMLKYGISDLRSFFDSDIKWLNNFGFLTFDNIEKI